ncbi:MAG: thioredoxin family protein [Bacteroidota bacterium]
MKAFSNFLLLAALILTFQNVAAQDGIAFEHGKWAEVKAKAKAENKLIFVDAYAVWCGPCKWMARTTFLDEKVADHYNASFINYKLDMEKGEGPELARAWKIRAYPTLLFIDGEGEVMHKNVGAMAAPEFLSMGEMTSQPGFMPISKMKSMYEAGDYDREFLFRYITRGMDSDLDVKDAITEYRKEMKGDKLFEENNWEVFKRVCRDTDSEEFQYVADNRSRFEEKFGADVVP